MNPSEEDRMIAQAVRQTFLDAGLPWPPASAGPVRLNDLIGAYPLVHEEVPGLTCAVVADRLARWGVRWSGGPQPDPPLDGFIYANARRGYIFVRRGDGLPRRRFTAAHELGHYRLHLAPELERRDPADAEMVERDEKIKESSEAELTAMERQANRFAAELLMPEAVCRELHATYSRRYRAVARFLVHHLSGELLVSRQAMYWRLLGLKLIEKNERLAKGREDDTGRETAEAV